MNLDNLVSDAKVIAVVCNQYGDTGKGKFTDYLASDWADIIARGTGGNNAGHTVVENGIAYDYHSLPVGVKYDSAGKTSILGNGMVIDVFSMTAEMDKLSKEGITFNNLMISKDAHVIMPYHVARDRLQNQSQKNGGIGSTGRGIAPAYTDKIYRKGVRIQDLFDLDFLESQIKSSLFYTGKENVDDIIDALEPVAQKIKPYMRDTIKYMHESASQGKRILLEGAQGLLLSIEHGTYPFVTSSDCSINGTASGVGLSAKQVDLTLGIAKFPYMTRVGGGPFPTEIGSSAAEKYGQSDDVRLQSELEKARIPYVVDGNGKVSYDNAHKNILKLMNSHYPLEKNRGIRLAGGEFGVTTGRPRRIGWTEFPGLKYAAGINGRLLILTKADVISGMDQFKLAYGYTDNGAFVDTFRRDVDFLKRIKPKYITYDGYGSLDSIDSFQALPSSLKQSISDLENMTSARVVAVSIGPEKKDTILKEL